MKGNVRNLGAPKVNSRFLTSRPIFNFWEKRIYFLICNKLKVMMKKLILIIFITIGLISSKNVSAQSFTVEYDTIYATVGYSTNINDLITNITNNPITLNWKITSTNFPSDWLNTLGICDNVTCYNNSSNSLHTTESYYSGVGDFHVQMDLSNTTSNGTYYITVSLSQQGNPANNRTETYVITKAGLGVSNVNSADANITLYPNPASNNINVVYSENTGIKNIAVYNIIGKVLTYYKVSGNSANLDISNIPSGIYFIRMLDANGNTVATRKFTRQ